MQPASRDRLPFCPVWRPIVAKKSLAPRSHQGTASASRVAGRFPSWRHPDSRDRTPRQIISNFQAEMIRRKKTILISHLPIKARPRILPKCQPRLNPEKEPAILAGSLSLAGEQRLFPQNNPETPCRRPGCGNKARSAERPRVRCQSPPPRPPRNGFGCP